MKPYRTERNRPYCGTDPALMEPDTEPTSHEWDAARIELGAWASDQQIERRALELANEALSDSGMDSEDYS